MPLHADLGSRWKSYITPPTFTVCPALFPPCVHMHSVERRHLTHKEILLAFPAHLAATHYVSILGQNVH